MKISLKKIIGNESYWTINKALAKRIGLKSTLLLQQFIDLEENYFDGEFYQSETQISKSIDLSNYQIRKCKRILVEHELIIITSKVAKGSTSISKQDHFTLVKDNILKYLTDDGEESALTSVKKESSVGEEITPMSVKLVHHVDKEKEDKEKVTNKKEITKDSFKDLKAGSQEALFFVNEDDIKNPTIDQQKALQLAKELNFNIY